MPAPVPVSIGGTDIAQTPPHAHSYRIKKVLERNGTQDGKPYRLAIIDDEERTTTPAAYASSTTGEGNNLQRETIGGITRIDDQEWVTLDGVVDGPHAATSVFEAVPEATKKLFADVVEHLQDAQLVQANETHNGIATHHYRYAKQSFADTIAKDADITSLAGDLWIDAQDGFLMELQHTTVVTGTPQPGQPEPFVGTSTLRYQLYDLDAPITIASPRAEPAGANSGVGTDIPEPPEGRLHKSQPGQAQYFVSGDQVTALMDFYQSEMAATGWTLRGSSRDEQEGVLTFAKDNRVAWITLRHETGSTRVLIVVSAGQ